MNEGKLAQISAWKSLNKISVSGITLRQYQIDIAYETMYKLITSDICYLVLGMRTGKTLTSLVTASLMFKNKENVLFITKKKAISSIKSDYDKLTNNFNLTIINYESLHKIENINYSLIICDEAHCIGAFPKPSNRFNDVRNLMGNNTLLILLSGTPNPESYSQLFHQFNLSKKSPLKEYKSFYSFAKDFVNITKKRVNNNMEINDYSDCNFEKLEPILNKYFIRYNQEAAGFENVINERVIKVDMKPITYAIANILKKDNIYNGKNDVILADTKVKLLNKLHQLYSGTCILESGESVIIDNSKAIFIKDNFSEFKIAIFYKFKAEFDMLKKIFVNFVETPEAFNDINNTLPFIGQCQSVKEGVDLRTAEYLINLNLDFSSTTYQQLKERSSHKDRKTPPQVIYIMASNGIDEDIYKVLQSKQSYTTSHFLKSKIFNNDRKTISNLFN